jgi:spermidine/putrescine transport system permease protein
MAFHVNSIKRTRVKNPFFNAMSSLSIPYLILLLVFVLLPFFFIVLYSFVQPSGNKLVMTLQNFHDFLSQANFLQATGLSIWFAFLTTVICLLVSYPMAYYMGRSKPKTGRTLMAVITVTMWINMLLRILALKFIFNVVDRNLIGTDFAVVFGMVYDYLPFMIIPLYTSIMKIDPALYDASKDLGANSIKTFFKVTLPLSMPGIISGITMVFLPSASSFVVPDLLGGGNPRYNLIGYIIERYFKQVNDFYAGSAMAIVLALTMLIFMFFINMLDRSNVKDDFGKKGKRVPNVTTLAPVSAGQSESDAKNGKEK